MADAIWWWTHRDNAFDCEDGRRMFPTSFANYVTDLETQARLLPEALAALRALASWNVGSEYCWCWRDGSNQLRPNHRLYDHHADCLSARDLIANLQQAQDGGA